MENYKIVLTNWVLENQDKLDFSIGEIFAFEETNVFYRICYKHESIFNTKGEIIKCSSDSSITIHKRTFDITKYLRPTKLNNIINRING